MLRLLLAACCSVPQVVRTDFVLKLVGNIGLLDFETRKDAAQVRQRLKALAAPQSINLAADAMAASNASSSAFTLLAGRQKLRC